MVLTPRFFYLNRSTRKDCTLSPLLFSLVIEPLAIVLHRDPLFTGISIGTTVDKITLYADDLLLFIADPKNYLSYIMNRIDAFGRAFVSMA